jgi:hypothetical protein
MNFSYCIVKNISLLNNKLQYPNTLDIYFNPFPEHNLILQETCFYEQFILKTFFQETRNANLDRFPPSSLWILDSVNF